MEVLHHRVEEEEQLLTRRRRPDLGIPNGDENSANGYESEEEVETNGIAEKNVYLDKDEGMWKCHHCIWTHKFAHPSIDHVHQKSFIHCHKETTVESSLSDKDLITEDLDIPKLVNDIINNPNGGNLDEEILSTFGRRSEEDSVRIDLVEDSDEEVIELEFERAVEKAHTHTPYCPNCSSRITKVVLRRRKRDTPRRDKPLNLLGCLECFSIFIPSGNCLNPFRLFGYKGKQETTQIVEDKLQSGANLPVSEGSTIKQGGNAFNLFKIFDNGTENVHAEESQGSDRVKQNGERKHEEESIKKPGRFHAISLPNAERKNEEESVNTFHSISLPNGERENGEESTKKPGRFNAFSSPRPSLPIGDVKINIADETVGEGNEIKEDQSTKTRGLDGEAIGETSDTRAKNEAKAIARSDNDSKSLEILKCIVYGGLIELITSLSVISSAAASDATTMNIIAIGMATLFSGLIIFGQNLMDLKDSEQQHKDKYQEALGRRGHFTLHASFAVLSYLAFGLVPPITYGFTFRESDNKDYKILAVGIASFACIFLLAIAKVYVRRSKTVGDYFKSIMYYMSMAISVSGVSYAAGDLVKMVMDKYGWFEPTQAVKIFMPGVGSVTKGSASF